MFQDKDLCTFDCYMLCSSHILSLLHILDDKWEDFQYNLECKSTLLADLFLDTDYLVHKEMVDMGSLLLALHFGNIYFKIIF